MRLPLLTYLVCQAIFLFWWAAFYPGLMNADSINFVLHVTTGPWINNASVLYDFLLLCSLKLTGDMALLTLAQTAAMSAALAYAVTAFRRIGVPGRWTAIAAIVVAAMPPTGTFIVFIWKDVPFTICAFLMVPTLAHLVSLRGSPDWRRQRPVRWLILALGAEMLGACMFRQDGSIIVGLAAVIIVFVLSGIRVRIAGVAAAAIIITLACDQFVYPAFGIERPSSSLLFGHSDADIAVVYAEAPRDFTAANIMLMKRVEPLAVWRAGFHRTTCYDSNTTTFVRGFNARASKVKIPLFRLWLQLVRGEPQLIIAARLCRAAIAWQVFSPRGVHTDDYASAVPANLFGWANVRSVRYNPYRADFATRPLFGNVVATFLRNASQAEQFDWVLWRGATWSYVAYLAVGLFAFRRRRWDFAALAAIVAGQQLMVMLDNPAQLFRYMATGLLVGPMMVPLFLARNRLTAPAADAQHAGPALDQPVRSPGTTMPVS